LSNGTVCLVTGAGGQIGRAIVDSLAARSVAFALLDREADAIDSVIRGLPAGSRSLAIPADISAEGAADDAVSRTVADLGSLDVLVNAAGVEGPIGRSEDVDLDDVRRVFEVNVFALWAFSAAAIRHFRGRQRGRVVNLASGAGLAGTAHMAAYSASKHAVVGVTRSMAREVAADGIAINAVCPGCVDSPMMTRIEERLGAVAGTGTASFLDAIPSGRYCRPTEVAEMVAWLALDAPTYITGAALVIDGGLRA
jgi:NAD(P)-dependent dehydrogenase (short-subunit alcohol dehydrogenase family)